MDPIGVDYGKAALMSALTEALSSTWLRDPKDAAADIVEAIELYVDAKLAALDPVEETAAGKVSAAELRTRRAILEGEAEAELTEAYESRPARSETPGHPAIGHGGEDGWDSYGGTDGESDDKRRV